MTLNNCLSDCENLIKHMLVVDVNKRYTMNQIKQHKWIIQGEPYEFMLEEDEFCFAQQHCGGENGKVEHNENILDQIKQLVGEDASVKVLEVTLLIQVFFQVVSV